MSNEPEIIELLGTQTTLKLEQTLGGQRKYIAAKPTPESSIVNVIGMEAAIKLATRFGGMLLYIPQHLAARQRNQEITLAVWSGEHKQLIGQRFGLVERTIRKVVQGDNHPRFGLSCRLLRAQTQGYMDGRQQPKRAGKESGGIGTPGQRTGKHAPKSH
ncbi:Mor transcription activator family protein [Endozoicomonas montiporae]|uniref:Mor transcription activator domain-containing protein n=1 Tax=Endozoicomonas montiporae CL-33 TaxID=570277 RepID=A0A142BHK6_9GAMM|nr:Mor transcription activator family protein [Endozoicomonas montiporae]AMO58232.1 Mor transcription activator domain-containing protein [Endozoicomonas montiporae CL-33]